MQPNMPPHMQPHMHHKPLVVHPVDHCVVETLKSLIGKCVLLETTRGKVEGIVCDCKPDHVILQCRGKNFYVRIFEIVWIMPE
uniref:DUF2642 domain-containing protein n=1 Tax=Paenibacillus sp. IHBB 10380 TaxID=1566358 RepID=UPI001F2968AE|nr:DUF2642 domain-containing protein [Paenibacillus sp. IHBB 10380]